MVAFLCSEYLRRLADNECYSSIYNHEYHHVYYSPLYCNTKFWYITITGRHRDTQLHTKDDKILRKTYQSNIDNIQCDACRNFNEDMQDGKYNSKLYTIIEGIIFVAVEMFCNIMIDEYSYFLGSAPLKVKYVL